MQSNEILAVMPQSELSQIKSDLQFIKQKMSSKNEENFSEQFIESKKVPKLLGVSSRTWQNYRDSKEIPFIQFGQKIWVKRKDLEAFLDKYYITNK
jgi:excisionase family DNA binding protein